MDWILPSFNRLLTRLRRHRFRLRQPVVAAHEDQDGREQIISPIASSSLGPRSAAPRILRCLRPSKRIRESAQSRTESCSVRSIGVPDRRREVGMCACECGRRCPDCGLPKTCPLRRASGRQIPNTDVMGTCGRRCATAFGATELLAREVHLIP